MIRIHHLDGKEAIPHRSQRFAVEADRAVHSSFQTGWSSAHDRHARGDECDLRHRPHGVWLADAAARLSQVANGVRVLRLLAGRRHLGDHECPPSGAGASPGRTEARATHRRARQSERQDVGPGGRAWVRRGRFCHNETKCVPKRSTEESSTCSLTRWDWCSVVWSMRRACRIVTGRSGSWPERRSTSPACGSFVPTRDTLDAWNDGCGPRASLWSLEIIRRTSKGFVVLPKRWIVERTFAWLGKYRRFSKDDEILEASSEAYIDVAMIHIMVRRLN